jgi:hypothetical protein
MRMNRKGLALMAAILAGSASLTPVQAVPPTPSPGYDARLQEQRAVVAPVAKPRRVKKPRAH